jgi:hypothetical protein
MLLRAVARQGDLAAVDALDMTEAYELAEKRLVDFIKKERVAEKSAKRRCGFRATELAYYRSLDKVRDIEDAAANREASGPRRSSHIGWKLRTYIKSMAARSRSSGFFPVPVFYSCREQRAFSSWVKSESVGLQVGALSPTARSTLRLIWLHLLACEVGAPPYRYRRWAVAPWCEYRCRRCSVV